MKKIKSLKLMAVLSMIATSGLAMAQSQTVPHYLVKSNQPTNEQSFETQKSTELRKVEKYASLNENIRTCLTSATNKLDLQVCQKTGNSAMHALHTIDEEKYEKPSEIDDYNHQ